MSKSIIGSKFKICILILIILLFIEQHAFAFDRFVSDTYGLDFITAIANDCKSAQTPCKTINHAMEQSTSGDTIKATIDEYNENISITPTTSLALNFEGGWERNFTVRNVNMKSMIRVSNGSVVKVDVGGIDLDISISGFILTGGVAETGGGVNIWSQSGGTKTISLYNNVVTENRATLYGGGIRVWDHSSTLNLNLSNNIITNNQADGTYGGGVQVYTVFPDATVTLTNNIIAGNNSYSGAGVHFTATGVGTMLTTFINNTITENNAQYSGSGLSIGSVSNSNATLNMTNSIIWGNTATNNGSEIHIVENDDFGDATTIVNAMYSDLGSIDFFGGTYNDNGGNINENPLFVDSTGEYYNLRCGSLCINSGNNAALPPDTTDLDNDGNTTEPIPLDLDGYPRIINGVVNMGAYESSLPPTKDELAGDFGASGVWHFDGSTWIKMTFYDPDDIAGWVTWANCLALDFGTSGLWNYDGTTWSKKSSWNAGTGGLCGWGCGLAVDFDGNGLWNYDGSTWSRKTSWDPDDDLTGWYGGLAVDFGTNGLWNYNGTIWSKETSWDVGDGGMAGWTGGLAVDFDGNGLWNYNGTTWTKKTSWNPGSGGLCGWAGGLAVDFDGNGLWNYNGTTWSKTTSLNPERICPLGNGLAADFGTNGVWYYDGLVWSKKTNWNAENLTDVDLY